MNQLTELFFKSPKAIVCENPLTVSSSSSSSSFLENKIYCSLEQTEFFHGAQFLLSSTSIDGGDHNVEDNQHLLKAFVRDMKSVKISDHFSRGLPCL